MKKLITPSLAILLFTLTACVPVEEPNEEPEMTEETDTEENVEEPITDQEKTEESLTEYLYEYDLSEKVEEFKADTDISVENDASILTHINMTDICNEKNLAVYTETGFNEIPEDQYDKENELTSYLPVNGSENLYIMVKTYPENKYKEEHTLEFYTKDGEDYTKTDFDPITWGDCMFSTSFDIYYLDPSMIVIYASPVFESYPLAAYLEDGKFKYFRDLLKEKLGVDEDYPMSPLTIKTDKSHISLTESGYCCDIVPTVIPEEYSEFIIDPYTKEIVDFN